MGAEVEKDVTATSLPPTNGSDVEGQEPAFKSEESSAAPPMKRSVTGVKWVLVILAILSSIFLYALDNTIVADVVPSITESLGDHELLPWLSVG